MILKEEVGTAFREREVFRIPILCFMMSVATSLRSYFPQLPRESSKEAFLAQKHLATRKTFTETGNSPSNSNTQRPQSLTHTCNAAPTPTHISKHFLYLNEKDKRSFFILFRFRSKRASQSWFPKTGKQKGMLQL